MFGLVFGCLGRYLGRYLGLAFFCIFLLWWVSTITVVGEETGIQQNRNSHSNINVTEG